MTGKTAKPFLTMPLLTIFSTPKPFTDPHIAAIQRNAIASWIQLGDEVEVFLIGEETGLRETAEEFDVQVLPNVARNKSGTPLVSSIFSMAEEASESPFLAYVNADIILMSDLIQALKNTSASLESNLKECSNSSPIPPFLLIGQRWDLDIIQILSFPENWQDLLRLEVKQRGKLHRPAGSDYFLYPRNTFHRIPDFAIGRAGWDNWMIYHAHHQGYPVIDGTTDVMIVHQNHDYRHLPNGKPHYDLEESQHNMDMAGGMKHMYMVLDANYQLINGEIRKSSFSLPRFIRWIERWVMPNADDLRSFRGTLTRMLKRLRRKLV